MKYGPIAMAMASELSGRSFVLVMEHDQKFDKVPFTAYRDNRDVSFHPRERQPCWGELRKYTKNYPEECTQPENGKPTDLWWTFPEGRPLGLAVDYSVNTLNAGLEGGSQATNRVFEKLFDKNHSIFPQMIGNVEFIYNSRKNIIGFYMENLEIDPTVLVHYLRISYQYLGEHALTIKTYVDAGLTWREALALHYLNKSTPIWNGYNKGYGGFVHSVKRVLEGNPRDLSGGTLRDRVDYNRTSIDELFCYDPGEKKGLTWEEVCKKANIPQCGFVMKPLEMKDIVAKLKPIFAEVVKGESTKRNLFVWKAAKPELAARQKVLKVA